jgi:hypothetical protein
VMAFRERTIVETFDPDDGDKRVTLFTLEGVSISPTGSRFVVDGKALDVYQPVRVEVNTKARMITTTITVMEG